MACSCSNNEWCNIELDAAVSESAAFGTVSAREYILNAKIRAEINRVRTELSDLADACDALILTPGTASKNAREKLDFRVKPCLAAFAIMEYSTAKEILAEIKEVLSNDGRPSCGLDSCTCHLRRLTAFLTEWRNDELVNLEKEIANAEDRRHADRDSAEAFEEFYNIFEMRKNKIQQMWD